MEFVIIIIRKEPSMMMETPEKESLTVEFKSDRKCLSDSDIIDAVVGLANTEGGTLYLGIEDNGTVTGLHTNHDDCLKMSVLVANRTVPSVSARIDMVEINGFQVMVFEVAKSRSIVATAGGKVLKRRLKANGEPENVPMFPYEYSSRLADLGNLDFSRKALQEVTLDDFDENEIKRLRKTIELRSGERSLLELPDEELFRALAMVTDIDGRLVPTVTGLLLVGKEESIAKHLPTAQAAFQVLEGTNVRINELLRKPLIAIFDFFEQMIKPWNPEREMDFGLLRIPIPEFEPRAFREALINAFSHRDYTILQMTRVLIDDEGLTISNPGSFVEGLDLKNLISADPHGRNPALADALKRIGLAERTGRGIDRIFEGSIIYGRPLPDYSESNENSVKVFIARGLPDLTFYKMLKDEQNRLGKSFSINQLLVLSLLRSYKKLLLSELQELTNITEIKLKAILVRLEEAGLVEAVPNGRGKAYILSAKVYKADNKSIAYVRQTKIDKIKYPELVLKLAEAQGEITVRDVTELLNITVTQARYLLNKMIEQGKIEKNGKSRNTTYGLPK